jgi:hypothetical protein
VGAILAGKKILKILLTTRGAVLDCKCQASDNRRRKMFLMNWLMSEATTRVSTAPRPRRSDR